MKITYDNDEVPQYYLRKKLLQSVRTVDPQEYSIKEQRVQLRDTRRAFKAHKECQ